MISLDEQGLLTRISPSHAVKKDTVNVPAHGYVILRWKTDSPGYWFFHCQTNSHIETGQATVLQVGEVDDIPMPPADFPTCSPWSKQ
ncbi:laccase-25-like [Anneissia japonica]|uniref:laccase-25-like n=1 Tax=Anneissia japonica TaxID=1529436 RepID=UPI001425A63D|nr:laccase-25-like [Anneissia japonica]